MTRQPTEQEYLEFNGLHCKKLWPRLPDEWRCPSCQRTKREIMIWGKRKGANARIYGDVGFKCGLHTHHDHSGLERFPETILCNACNVLDGRLKRKLNTIEEFSFSPQELKCIIKKAYPNTSITDCDIDINIAAEIYSRQKKGIRVKSLLDSF